MKIEDLYHYCQNKRPFILFQRCLVSINFGQQAKEIGIRLWAWYLIPDKDIFEMSVCRVTPDSLAEE